MENNLSYLKNEVSFFDNCKTTSPAGSLTVEEVFGLIADGQFSEDVLQYQTLLKTNPQAAKNFKSGKMCCITPAGVFDKRNKESLISPSGLIVLDVDDVPEEEYANLRTLLCADRYVLAVMDSPGGSGLKIWVPMHFGHGEETYKHRYNEAAEYFASSYGVPICDKRKKDTVLGVWIGPAVIFPAFVFWGQISILMITPKCSMRSRRFLRLNQR